MIVKRSSDPDLEQSNLIRYGCQPNLLQCINVDEHYLLLAIFPNQHHHHPNLHACWAQSSLSGIIIILISVLIY